MRTSRFTEQQVVATLRQVENGTAVAEVCRTLGVSEQTFSRWKRKDAELRPLRHVEDENRRHMQLVAGYPHSGWDDP